MEIADAPVLVALAIAVAAGVVSFLSPCVFPLVPGYLAFISGSASGGSAAPDAPVVRRSLAFVLGFTCVFTLLGLGTAAITEQLLQHRGTLEFVGGLLIVLLGLTMVWGVGLPAHGGKLTARLREPSGLLGALAVGAVFAIAWTPCIGPALGAILALAGSTGDAAWGAALLLAYSLGLGIPFLIAAFGVRRFYAISTRVRPHMRTIQVASGTVLVIMGALVATGAMARLTSHLARYLPDFLI